MRYNNNDYYRPSGFGGFSLFPPVIKMLLISNIGLFVLRFFLDSFTLDGVPLEEYIIRYFALIPLGYGFKIWQPVTYMFLHADFTHVFFNMFAMWMFGAELEQVLGSRKFALYYFVCGIGGGLAHLLLGPVFGHPAPTIGASGAVYGLLLAFGLIFPDRLIFLYFLIPIKAKYFVMLYILLEIFAVGSNDLVAHLAHLGGAFTGYVFLLIEMKRLPLQRFFRSLKNRSDYEVYNGSGYRDDKSEEAQFYDISTGRRVEGHPKKDNNVITQQMVDEILDKISKGGYQSLTAEEKRILFEASKHLD
jgi:membrane associated rhomboid family serine protease